MACCPTRRLFSAGERTSAGCVAIGAESAGGPFLEFWKQHCQRHMNPLDSRWLNLVHLFPHSVNDDPAYDVGSSTRRREKSPRQKDQILAGGRPLRLLQFKGFDPERSELLTTEQQAGARVILSEHPVLAELSGARAAALLRAQYERHTALPYGWASSACGTELDPATRATYLGGSPTLSVSRDARLQAHSTTTVDWDSLHGSHPCLARPMSRPTFRCSATHTRTSRPPFRIIGRCTALPRGCASGSITGTTFEQSRHGVPSSGNPPSSRSSTYRRRYPWSQHPGPLVST